MTDTLRDRIAAVAAEHRFADHRTSFGDKCVCGWASQDVSHADHMADVLIRELGLQTNLAKRIINGKPDQWVRRHVTDWEIVDV